MGQLTRSCRPPSSANRCLRTTDSNNGRGPLTEVSLSRTVETPRFTSRFRCRPATAAAAGAGLPFRTPGRSRIPARPPPHRGGRNRTGNCRFADCEEHSLNPARGEEEETFAGSAPAFLNRWSTPFGIVTNVPAGAVKVSSPSVISSVAFEHVVVLDLPMVDVGRWTASRRDDGFEKERQHSVGRLADHFEGVGVAGHVDRPALAGCELGTVVLRHEGPPLVSEWVSLLRWVCRGWSRHSGNASQNGTRRSPPSGPGDIPGLSLRSAAAVATSSGCPGRRRVLLRERGEVRLDVEGLVPLLRVGIAPSRPVASWT